jgi:hypothetical protein
MQLQNHKQMLIRLCPGRRDKPHKWVVPKSKRTPKRKQIHQAHTRRQLLILQTEGSSRGINEYAIRPQQTRFDQKSIRVRTLPALDSQKLRVHTELR